MMGESPTRPGYFQLIPLVETPTTIFPSESMPMTLVVPYCSLESLLYHSWSFWLLMAWT